MFNHNQIAKAQYGELEAKYHQLREAEGMTVQVPNIIDRVLLAVGAFMSRRLPRTQQPGEALHRSGAIAK